jgi:hypothetical protein
MISRRYSRPSSKGIWKGSTSTAHTLSDGPVVECQEAWIMGAIIMGRGPSLALVISAGAFSETLGSFSMS